MSYSAFTLLLILLVCPLTWQQTLPPKAVNAERIKLLKDSLSWMTFRKNGQLASDHDLEPFFEVLKEKYLRSKYYKTMIIAFTHGVLPKLILKENDPCDSAYTFEYRDSHNNSVTDAQLKTFILGSYDKREEASRQFCDYREGLVCNQQTNKCECPYGSKMEPISQGSTSKRCLVQENEVCSLIDLDHDPTSNYGALKKYLPEMVFNLEKPLSCKMGTQCRFKSTNPATPLCYSANSGPWDKGRWDIDFGEECTLGLYGDTGQCKVLTRNVTIFNGYTCFKFGPRSQPKSPQVGLCAYDIGSYAITSGSRRDSMNGLYWDLQMIGFVSPATTSLRGKQLLDFYSQYKKKLEIPFSSVFTETTMSLSPGRRCNIAKTEKLLELWKFFKSLEETPPDGKDYVATEAELQAKFKEAEDLTVDGNKRICRVRSELYPRSETQHALRCVGGFGDSDGNDGKCEEIPESEDVTYEWAKSFMRYRVGVYNSNNRLYYEERDYRRDIYEPDLECDPKLGPPPGSQGAAPSTDTDALEGGYCPPDRGCYKDYGGNLEIYHNRNCSLKEANPIWWLNCQDLNDNRRYGRCEDEHLDKVFYEELETVSSFSGLQRGDACEHYLEVKIKDWIERGGRQVKGNKYKRLIELYNVKNGIGGKTLCDRTKLLECSQKSGTCECLPNTQPREVNLEPGMTIFSDYCYVASDDCDIENALSFIFEKSSQTETNTINRHYNVSEGGPELMYSCRDTNWCVFAHQKADGRVECTVYYREYGEHWV